ncbi:Ribonuclease H-like superfamily [Sesbania bispinosa]|nr:Ribonuclease H-like superfamily [Sesbania bispinosa]
MEPMVFSIGSGFQQVPPKPPEGGGGESEQVQQPIPSFKDKVLGTKVPTSSNSAQGGIHHQQENGGVAVEPTNTKVPNPNTVVQSPSNPITDSLHGDWLVVSRRKKVSFIRAEDAASSLQRKSQELRMKGENVAKQVAESSKTWHRKRPRKDVVPVIKNLATNVKEYIPPAAVTHVEKNNVVSIIKKNPPKTIMIGNTKVFDLGGGAKSVLDLSQVGPNRFKFNDDTAHSVHDMDSEDGVPQARAMDHEGKEIQGPSEVDRGPHLTQMLTESHAITKPAASPVWKGIIKAKDSLKTGFSLRLREGNTPIWYTDWTGCGNICDLVPFVNTQDTNKVVRDIIYDGRWNFQSIRTALPLMVSNSIVSNDPSLHHGQPDSWIWNPSHSGIYSAASGYNWLLHNASLCNSLLPDVQWVWKLACTEKAKFFIWLILNDGIPINEKRFRCHISPTPSCGRCSHDIEDSLHCLRDCPHSKEVWLRLGQFNNHFFRIHNINVWLRKHLGGVHGTLFLATLWWLWRWRNNMYFDHKKWNINYVLGAINSTHDDFIRFLGAQGGLQFAWSMGWKELLVECDALEAVNLVQEGDLHLHKHHGLIQSIRDYSHRDWTVSIVHVFREMNQAADLLARNARGGNGKVEVKLSLEDVESVSSLEEVLSYNPRQQQQLQHKCNTSVRERGIVEIRQIKKNLQMYENDASVKLVILKANGKAFCAGGDIVSVITSSLAGHWTYTSIFYRKLLTLEYYITTYKKPLVSLINGFVMGAGAGLSINSRFRVVTEKTVFAMPEVSIGLFPDVGSSYFLSRLSGYFGEYLGLTGTHLDGPEMVACGLATHFVPSVKLNLLENALQNVTSSDLPIATIIETFTEKANLKEDSSFRRLEEEEYKILNNVFNEITPLLPTLSKELLAMTFMRDHNTRVIIVTQTQIVRDLT